MKCHLQRGIQKFWTRDFRKKVIGLSFNLK